MKYILLTEKNNDIFTKEFNSCKDAILTAVQDFDHLTNIDKKQYSWFYVSESVNADEEAPNHYEGSIIYDCFKWYAEEETRQAVFKLFESIDLDYSEIEKAEVYNALTLHTCRSGRNALHYFDGITEKAIYLDDYLFLTAEEIEEELF